LLAQKIHVEEGMRKGVHSLSIKEVEGGVLKAPATGAGV
jgi:hypothetical protein